MQQVTQCVSFLLPKHVIKPDLLESGKYHFSNLTTKQLLLRETESTFYSETCKYLVEETHALLPFSSKDVEAKPDSCYSAEPLLCRLLGTSIPCFNNDMRNNLVILKVP